MIVVEVLLVVVVALTRKMAKIDVK